MTDADALAVWTRWLADFRADSLKSIDAAKRHFTDGYVEFHTIWPALLKGRDLFHAFDGARYAEPLHATRAGERPSAGPREQVVRAFENAVLVVVASQAARLEADGTIGFHLNRQTWVLVRVEGAWLMAAGHNSPPASEQGPYGHNQFAGDRLGYS
jgi:hypothetical protein